MRDESLSAFGVKLFTSVHGTKRTWRPGCSTSVYQGGADIALTRDNVRVRPFAIVGRAKFAIWCLYQKPLRDRVGAEIGQALQRNFPASFSSMT
jgi:hypothetical protein